MSLSKIFKHSDSFVPRQILPRQNDPFDSNRLGEGRDDGFPDDHQNAFVAEASPRMIDTAQHPPAPSKPEPQQAPLLAPAPPLPEQSPPPPATLDLDLIREQAFTQGVLEGRRQAEEDFEGSALTLRSACSQLTNLHETILRNNLREMHELVMLIAEKVLRQSLTGQSETILTTIEEAIRLAVKSEEFQIRVNPEDLEVVQRRKKEIIDAISGLDNIVLKADSAIERGGCVLESANCTVDATVSSQLQVIREALDRSRESGPTATSSDTERGGPPG